MKEAFNKMVDLLLSNEQNTILGINVLKGQPDLEEEVFVAFKPVLTVF